MNLNIDEPHYQSVAHLYIELIPEILGIQKQGFGLTDKAFCMFEINKENSYISLAALMQYDL